MATKLNKTLEKLLASAGACWNTFSPLSGERRPAILVVDKPTVNAFARMLVRTHEDPEYGAVVNAEYDDELHALSRMFEAGFVQVSLEQEHDAVAWLLTNRHKLPLGERELQMLRRLRQFSLAGFDVQRFGMRWAAAPIWKVHDTFGHSFQYVAWPWQSGRKPQLV